METDAQGDGFGRVLSKRPQISLVRTNPFAQRFPVRLGKVHTRCQRGKGGGMMAGSRKSNCLNAVCFLTSAAWKSFVMDGRQ
jgi:hypothetical protein